MVFRREFPAFGKGFTLHRGVFRASKFPIQEHNNNNFRRKSLLRPMIRVCYQFPSYMRESEWLDYGAIGRQNAEYAMLRRLFRIDCEHIFRARVVVGDFCSDGRVFTVDIIPGEWL